MQLQIDQWQVDGQTGELRRGDVNERLEPKTMALLCLLASRPGDLFSREQILAAVWPEVIVGDDALARALFKLRRALGDDAKTPRYIETISKRGYRLIAPVRALDDAALQQAIVDSVATAAVVAEIDPSQKSRGARPWPLLNVALPGALLLVVGAWVYWTPHAAMPASAPHSETTALVERADDFYYRYERVDNEAAIELYERILTREPDQVAALAGLANALTQRMIRWPQLPARHAQFSSLTAALANGHLAHAEAQRVLARAELLARRAVSLAGTHVIARRALGLVLATQSRFDEAMAQYEQAVALDTDAWGVWINLAEAQQLTGQEAAALSSFMQAHAAMTRRYAQDKQHLLPWYADLAVLIGDRLRAASRSVESESWYRQALSHSPLHPAASIALAQLLTEAGRSAEAGQLCNELNARIGPQAGCVALLEGRLSPNP